MKWGGPEDIGTAFLGAQRSSVLHRYDTLTCQKIWGRGGKSLPKFTNDILTILFCLYLRLQERKLIRIWVQNISSFICNVLQHSNSTCLDVRLHERNYSYLKSTLTIMLFWKELPAWINNKSWLNENMKIKNQINLLSVLQFQTL